MIKTFDNENTLSQNLALEIFKELKNKKISIIPEKYYS